MTQPTSEDLVIESSPRPVTDAVVDRVNALRQQLGGLVTLQEDNGARISWQCADLDQLMPGGGLQPGMIVELLYDRLGSGATSLAMHCAKQAVDQQLGPLVVVDRGQKFYPPAAVARGIEVRDLIVVRVPDAVPSAPGLRPIGAVKRMSCAEEIWALDQALRCKGVAVVLAWLDRIDSHAYRRLQLAAEVGKTLAIFIRPAQVREQPTWADVQLLVSPNASEVNQQSRVTADKQEISQRRLAPCRSRRKVNGNRKQSERPLVERTRGASLAQTSLAQTGYPQGARFLRATLLRQRGRAGTSAVEGTSVELMVDESLLQVCKKQGNVASNQKQDSTGGISAGIENRNEASTLHMASRMAHPATRRRSTGA